MALVASVALTVDSPNGLGPHAPGPACRPTDAYATGTRAYISEIVTGNDTASANRRGMYNLPAVADTAIYFVRDSATCARAARAHARAEGTSTAHPYAVYVLRVGPTRYLVFNGSTAGEFLVYDVFDSAFKYLTGYMS